MGIGRMWYLARRFLRHGARGAWIRERIAPRIHELPPVPVLDDPLCEIHALTSGEDWLPLIWSLRSFFAASQRRYGLYIHDDGSLPAFARDRLHQHFPGMRFVSRAEADLRMADELALSPTCRSNRTKFPLLLKAFDFPTYLRGERMLLIDSDVLFFSRPSVLLQRIEDPAYHSNSLNRDWRYGYSFDDAELTAAGFAPIPPLINSGLGLIHRDSLPLRWAEEFLHHLPALDRRCHLIEQSIIALSSARFGYEMLPSSYDVYTGPTDFSRPVRHYSGPTRSRLYSEGIPFLWQHRRKALCLAP